MSSDRQSEREWRFFLEDMLVFCEKIGTYTQGMGKQAFLSDSLTYDATLRNIELIGEAATKIPGHVRDAHPEFPWHPMISTRNRLIHVYSGIDDDLVWSIIQDDIPELAVGLRRWLSSFKDDSDVG